MQASQVSVWLGDQFGLGILKATINLLPKPDERLSSYVIVAKGNSATMCAEWLKKYTLKYVIKKILKKDSERVSKFIQMPWQATYVYALSHL